MKQHDLSSGSVNTMPKEFKIRGFTMKTHEMFSIHTIPKNLKIQQSPVISDLSLRETRSGKSRDYRDVIVFE